MIPPDDVLLQHLQIEDVSRYLSRSGWQRSQHPNDRVLVFVAPMRDDFDNTIELILPTSLTYADASDRLREAIHLISVLEREPLPDTIRRIRSFDRDILRSRIVDEHDVRSSISLELGARVLVGLRDLVGFAACSEEEPRPYFLKAPSIARRHVERCRFGHTMAGSFVINIESPVVVSSDVRNISHIAPFERRVMHRIVRGFALTQEANLTGDLSILTKNFQNAFNANMCEALLRIADEAEGVQVDCSVLWSRVLDVPPSIPARAHLALNRETSLFLESAARDLRALDEERNVELVGRVVQLRSESSPRGDFELFGEHTAVVHWRQENLKVKVALTSPDYRQACDAHKNGADVRVKGTLERRGKLWVIHSPAAFSIVDGRPG